jgi:hypothetical protein
VGNWKRGAFALLILVMSAAAGCAAGSGATANPGAAVFVTDRGASSLVNAPLDRTAQWTRAAFAALNIRMKEVEQKTNVRTFRGATADLDVTAELDRAESGGTRIVVTARRNAATWDKEFAQRVLTRIVRRG